MVQIAVFFIANYFLNGNHIWPILFVKVEKLAKIDTKKKNC